MSSGATIFAREIPRATQAKKTLHRSPEFCGNPLKLGLNEQANQMGTLAVRWDL